MASGTHQDPIDVDMIEQETDAAPSSIRTRPAADNATTERSATVISSVRDEPYPSASQPRRPDEHSTNRYETAVSTARDEPYPPDEQSADQSSTSASATSPEGTHPSSQSQPERPNDLAAAFQRDPAIAVAYGFPMHKFNHPKPPPQQGRNAIPGGLAFQQMHLPPQERKPQYHLEQTMRNLVDFGSLNDPSEVERNSPVSIPSFATTLAKAKAERLQREAERDAKAEREKVEREKANPTSSNIKDRCPPGSFRQSTDAPNFNTGPRWLPTQRPHPRTRL
jgi:hypothetical protein